MTPKKILYSALGFIAFYMAVLLLVLTSSCNRKMHSSQQRATVTTDTAAVVIATKTTGKADSSGYASHEASEEREAVPGGSATIELEAVDLKPVTDADGKTKGRTYRADSGRTKATVTVGADGKVRFDCKTDSLERVILKYRKDSSWAKRQYDSVVASSVASYNATEHTSTLEEVAESSGSGGLLTVIKWFLIGVLTGYCVRWYHKL